MTLLLLYKIIASKHYKHGGTMELHPPKKPVETTPVPPIEKLAPAPEAWEEFLEDDADCCGGCHHKPR
jgi:hypothetical protein